MIDKRHAPLLADEVGARNLLHRRSRPRQERHHPLGRRAQLPGAELPARRDLAGRRRALLSLERQPAGRRRAWRAWRAPDIPTRRSSIRRTTTAIPTAPATSRAGSPSTSPSTRSSPRPVTLPELRADGELGDMVLLRKGSRLSVQPVTAAEWKRIVQARRAKMTRGERRPAFTTSPSACAISPPARRSTRASSACRCCAAGRRRTASGRALGLARLGRGAFLALERVAAAPAPAPGAAGDRPGYLMIALAIARAARAEWEARLGGRGRRRRATARPTPSTSPIRRGTGWGSRTGRSRAGRPAPGGGADGERLSLPSVTFHARRRARRRAPRANRCSRSRGARASRSPPPASARRPAGSAA